MDDLIEALNIFRKYSNEKYPCVCEHETLYIHGADPEKMSVKDIERLEELGFVVEEDFEKCFVSFRFGSS